nr:MAG TPA: hypothetical protein [Caudoviricetes sp.]
MSVFKFIIQTFLSFVKHFILKNRLFCLFYPFML